MVGLSSEVGTTALALGNRLAKDRANFPPKL